MRGTKSRHASGSECEDLNTQIVTASFGDCADVTYLSSQDVISFPTGELYICCIEKKQCLLAFIVRAGCGDQGLQVIPVLVYHAIMAAVRDLPTDAEQTGDGSV